MSELLEYKKPTGYNLRNEFGLLEPRTNLVTCGDRAFYLIAPKLWNSGYASSKLSKRNFAFQFYIDLIDAGPERSSVFGFFGNLTMVSYALSRGEAVVLFSTMHHTATTEGGDKPEIILHYNKTKSGVDNMDHLVTIFSCRRKTN